MDVVTLCLILLLAVVVSEMIADLLPAALPRPLVQIAFGVAIGMIGDIRVELDPEIFFLLLVPPLLFLDGWRIPKDELFRDMPIVLGLALGLVFLTVLGMGFFIHWMIPAMPLAVAFALAAVLSPTDPIAFSAIANRVPVPRRVMHILEGEALLNDASGLVCLRFAVGAVLAGSFSLQDAAATFAWTAAVGAGIGTAFTWAIVRLRANFAARFGINSASNILTSILLPFAAYLLAEHAGASGILAAAAAGIAMSFASASADVGAATRLRRSAVWDMIQFTLNGVIFVLLGEQLPDILAGARETVGETAHASVWWMLLYVVAIVSGLALLRFLWVWLTLAVSMLRAKLKGRSRPRPPLRLVAAISIAGARGAITLAGVLTLPIALPDGSAFPARDLSIFLAFGVILASLVIAAAGLPLLLRGLSVTATAEEENEPDEARIAAAKAAIAALEKTQRAMASDGGEDADGRAEIAARLMKEYRDRIEMPSEETRPDAMHRLAEAERRMRLAAIRAERKAVLGLARQRRIRMATARPILRQLDLIDARLAEGPR